MPFGAIFGALFLSLFAVWSAAARVGASEPRMAARFLALAAGALALGLLTRRGWARWAAAAFAVGIAVLSLRQLSVDVGVISMVSFLGALVLATLLAVPATGRLGTGARRRGAMGRALGAGVGIGVCGFAGSVWFAASQDAPAVAVAATGSGATRPAARGAARPGAERVPWTDFGSGLENARAEGKPILATFVTNWCGYCRKMDGTTWRDPKVVQRLAGLVAVRVDAEDARERSGYAGAELARRYGVQGYPTLLVLDSAGRVVSRVSGYLEARDLLDWLDEVLGHSRPRGAENLSVSQP